MAKFLRLLGLTLMLAFASLSAWAASVEQIDGNPLTFKVGTSSTTLVQAASMFTGGLTISTSVVYLYAVTPTATVAWDLGQNRTDNGYAYIDFHGDSTYSDYGFRFLRGNSGPNSSSVFYNRGTVGLVLYTVEAAPLTFGTNNIERMRISPAGPVGIGTVTPSAWLDVSGSIYSRAVNAGAATSIDWSSGNQQYTSANCGAFTFSNMQDGGQYTLAVQGQGGGTCSFSHSGLTVDMASTDSGRQPINTDMLYSFKRIGATVYVMPPMNYANTGCQGYDQWMDISPNNVSTWSSVAMSADGSVIAVTPLYTGSGQIYTSTNGGASWTARDSSRTWAGIASSSDGTKMVATVYTGGIYTSTNSGATWTQQASAGSRNWLFVASSSDGTKLVTEEYGGKIYTSTDSGVTWAARDSNRNWYGITSSSDGTKLMANVYGGQIYTSTDSGVTWTARDSSRNWGLIGSSNDGTVGVSSERSGGIYTTTNSGVNWTLQNTDTTAHWGASVSGDGSVLAAATSVNGLVYTSQDGGTTWATHPGVKNWRAIAFSTDGSIMVVAGSTGVYKATCQ